MWYDGHRGYDFQVAQWTPVQAAARGKVTNITKDYGQVELDHSGYGYPYKTTYTHMERAGHTVGAVVKKGEIIGWVSNVSRKGEPVGVHLHFVVHRKDGRSWKLVDPYGGSGEPVLWK